ncbi:unnamed protein product [Rotaria sp. Silwood2]|nr:unnamed protein product [Rotaria sp. Silwood2]CAF2521566.1 unnamed protein product [Rotaria sp. Silwood2]CAF2779891.1 unnamed protein product [Rotaria sp. Silwood2]CAF2954091.1 unnamed protein product [Rotaria sp. Silwood2]CAF3857762.1 unnamed protein product [Rotaria sp. Silwood2]
MAVNNVDLPASMLQSEDFDLIAYEAQRIVDQVLAQSLLNVYNTSDTNLNANRNNHERGRFIELENDEWQKKSQGQSIVRWPTIDEFTHENVGLDKINEYIEKEWKTTPGGQDACWLYAIDFLEKKALEFTELYIYRVRYSIPTRRQPIPRQTVSIYFTLDVSKVKPKNTPIQVSFVLETMRLVHHPDTFRFRQTWLENIILLKEKMTNGIDF